MEMLSMFGEMTIFQDFAFIPGMLMDCKVGGAGNVTDLYGISICVPSLFVACIV